MKNKKLSVVFLLLFIGATSVLAQDPAAAVPADQSLFNIMNIVLLAAVGLTVAVALYFVVRTNQLMYNHILDLQAAAKGMPLPSAQRAAAKQEGPSIFQQLKEKYWEKVVPIEEEGDIMLDHSYDGIRELDNSLPPWWLNMFYLSIIWAFGYMYYYHWGGDGPDQHQEYLMEVAEVEEMKKTALRQAANNVDESNVVLLADNAALGEGEMIFNANCVACHRADLGGMTGPNLTDEYWLHGGGITNVFTTIKYGVQEKGMQEWGSRLSPTDMQKVASYILSKQGTNPADPKEPEGEIWVENNEENSAEETAPTEGEQG